MVYRVAAIDLGASSGRVMLGCFDAPQQCLSLQEIHRFSNELILKDGILCWDIEHLENEMYQGLGILCDQHQMLHSVGVDSWGVDYVCLDRSGKLLAPAVCYRDDRTKNVGIQLCQALGALALYRHTGIQFQPFNTLYQLKAQSLTQADWLEQIDKVLLLPDYFHYRLTGNYHWDYTNASTTGMLDCVGRDWDDNLLKAVGARRSWFGTLDFPGTQIGEWLSPNGEQIPVISPPTHDTASAIAAAPLQGNHTAYISSGTWSLIGIESEVPYTDELAFAANLTNEGGANQHYRVLKNVMGMWLIEGLLKEWPQLNVTVLIEQAQSCRPFESLVDPNHPVFVHPHSMTQAISEFCHQTQQSVPRLPGQFARCVLDSLALSYRQSLEQIEQVSGTGITTLRIVGGGSLNELLDQLCADVCELPVMTGPTEASALGNIGYQLIGLGAISDGRELRQVIARNFQGKTFHPQPCPGLLSTVKRFTRLSQMSVNELQIQFKESV